MCYVGDVGPLHSLASSALIVKSGMEIWFYISFYFSFVTWNLLDNFSLADLLNINQQTKEYGSASKVEPRHLLGKPMTRIETADLTFFFKLWP